MKRFEDLKKGDFIYYYNGTEFLKCTVQNIFPAKEPDAMYIEVAAFIHPIFVSKYVSVLNYATPDRYIFVCKEIINSFITERQKFFDKMRDDAYEFIVDEIFKNRINNG